MPLNCGALLLWQSGFPPQAFPVVDFLPLVPSGCLFTANSSPPPGFALQSLHSSPQPPCGLGHTRPVWGVQGCGTDHLCRSHSVLSATDQPFHSPLTASDAPFLSELISPLVMGLPWMREPLPSFSSPPGSFFFPSFFHPTQLRGDLSCPFWCPRSSASVQLVFCENCSICRCILDAFVERDELRILPLLHHLGFLDTVFKSTKNIPKVSLPNWL